MANRFVLNETSYHGAGAVKEIVTEINARGFKFLGPVTVYAFMQSVGLVNDHARFCFRYKELRNDAPCIARGSLV